MKGGGLGLAVSKLRKFVRVFHCLADTDDQSSGPSGGTGHGRDLLEVEPSEWGGLDLEVRDPHVSIRIAFAA
jgi:hypothetical protein